MSSLKQVTADQSGDTLRFFKLVDYIRETLLSLLPQTKTTPHEVVATGKRNIVLTSFPEALPQIELVDILLETIDKVTAIIETNGDAHSRKL